MTTTTAFGRLADAAVSARTGADLYRFGLGDRIPDSALARNSDGTVTVTGIDLLKSGTFNGLALEDGDLSAMVDRFVTLRDSGVFLPPFRLDHSWSVLSVIGWFEELETYRRVDETDNVEKLFLRGDVRITGSVDYSAEQLVKAIKAGALRNRSSELGYYVTNAGIELPLVFYGCAFVDIPAVEGLAPVQLSRVRLSTPHSIVNLTEGSPSMDPEQIARLAALRAMTSLSAEDEAERDGLEELATETGTEIPEVEEPAGNAGAGEEDPHGSEAGSEASAGGDPAGVEETSGGSGTGGTETGTGGGETGTGTPAGETTEAPAGAPADEVETLRAEVTRLRAERTEREVERFRAAGILNATNEGAATTLLSHDDEEVRRSTGILLGSLPAPVTLGKRHGRTALSQDGNGSQASAGKLIVLGMPKDEVGPLWASLSTEERKLRQGEYDAWRTDREENGVRD